MTMTGIDDLAYKFWSIHPREIDAWMTGAPEMPADYPGGARAWFFACNIRETTKGLVAALEEAIEIIGKHVRPDALGADYMGDPDVPGGTRSWYVLDEALHYMRLAVEKAEGRDADNFVGLDGKRKPSNINFEAWSRTLVGFIRHKGLEQELRDWGGGWPIPIASKEKSPLPADNGRAE